MRNTRIWLKRSKRRYKVGTEVAKVDAEDFQT